MAKKTLAVAVALVVVTLGACSFAPPYHAPATAIPTHFKEAGPWQTARPADHMQRDGWWRVFNDPVLDRLEPQVAAANPNVAAAVARHDEAAALLTQARAGLFPTLDAGFGPTRQKLSAASQFQPDGANIPQQTLWRAQATASYEVDLFGRVASSIDAANADTQRNEALYRSVLLALQADVAQNYFALRELDAEASVFEQAIALRRQALQLVQRRYAEGDIAELDVSRAQAELAGAEADAMTVQRQRAASEHGLAVLLGKAPAGFAMASAPLDPVELRIPPGLPSALLERRPDIAAAERAMAAANARIGIAKAAFFPSLSLTGTGGFESATIGDLFKWSSRAFLLGPLAGTALTVPLFDGGRRKGQLAHARAAYEEEIANYRQQVLTAFREVEDGLSDMRVLADQTATQARAVEASTRAARISRTQYEEGAINYLDVIDAERTVLQARRSAVQLRGLQAAAAVNLIRALGGGWDDVVPKPSAAGAAASASATVAQQ
jgi:multidrug efflux system outer membrane protein